MFHPASMWSVIFPQGAQTILSAGIREPFLPADKIVRAPSSLQWVESAAEKWRLFRVAPFLCALAILCGCGDAKPTRNADAKSREKTGPAASIPENPSRILSLCTSATDTLVRLGEGGRLAGIDEYSRIVPGATNLAVLGKGGALSREQVLARRIDLAFVWWFQEDTATLLADLSVPVVRVRCGRVKELPDMIRLVGRSVGRAEAAERLAADTAAKLAALTNNAPAVAPRVYLELYGAFKTIGRDSFMNDLIELAGGKNIAADTAGSVLLSAERLLQADPEVILFVGEFTTADTIARRGGLENLSAVRRHRLRPVDRYWLVAGAGLPEAVAKLREAMQ